MGEIRKPLFSLDVHELAVRIAEAQSQTRRPLGFSAEQALDDLPQADREAVIRSAHACAEYIVEQMNENMAVTVEHVHGDRH